MSGAAPDRRGQLVAAAARLFAERSYEKVTTTEVAKAAGVAYGLIAHHFGNKRGLYLEVMRGIAAELSARRERPPHGDTLDEQLRHALAEHIAFIDGHASGFVAMMRGGLGADPEIRELVDGLRRDGAHRILRHLGVDEPVPAVLRATMRGWVGYLDELMLDRIDHRDTDADTLVDLAAATLVTALASAVRHAPEVAVAPRLAELLASSGSVGEAPR